MSIIVWDGTTLAADQAMWLNNVKYKVQKIRKIYLSGIGQTWLVGGVGNASFVNAGFRYFESNFSKTLKPDYKEHDNIKASDCYLIAIRPDKKIFLYDAIFNPIEILDNKTALGGASEVAIGALEAGASAKEVVEICIRKTDYAGLGVDELTF